jgi:hypothetical protein
MSERTTSKTVTFSLPLPVIQQLESIASDAHMSRSGVLSLLIQQERQNPSLLSNNK